MAGEAPTTGPTTETPAEGAEGASTQEQAEQTQAGAETGTDGGEDEDTAALESALQRNKNLVKSLKKALTDAGYTVNRKGEVSGGPSKTAEASGTQEPKPAQQQTQQPVAEGPSKKDIRYAKKDLAALATEFADPDMAVMALRDDLEDLLDDDFELDEAEAKRALKALLRKKPNLGKAKVPAPGTGKHNEGAPAQQQAATKTLLTQADLIKLRETEGPEAVVKAYAEGRIAGFGTTKK